MRTAPEVPYGGYKARPPDRAVAVCDGLDKHFAKLDKILFLAQKFFLTSDSARYILPSVETPLFLEIPIEISRLRLEA